MGKSKVAIFIYRLLEMLKTVFCILQNSFEKQRNFLAMEKDIRTLRRTLSTHVGWWKLIRKRSYASS